MFKGRVHSDLLLLTLLCAPQNIQGRRKVWMAGGGALCVQIDFTWTFQTNTMCNSINHVWSHFYKILVVLKYHRRLWANIFDTDISRCINTYIKVVYLAFFGIFMLLQMSVSKILAHRRLWYFKTTKILQKWLQTWFILLHLALVWNVHVKSIWTHSAPPPFWAHCASCLCSLISAHSTFCIVF